MQVCNGIANRVMPPFRRLIGNPRRNNSVLIGLRLHLKAGNQTLKQSIPVLMG